MNIQKFASFSENNKGGNPAGVVIGHTLPSAEDMQAIAKEVGYSETAFACPEGDVWRVRYFSPESEVPFCGHATIALGAALALQNGNGVFPLRLNDAQITVEGKKTNTELSAALQSPPTRSALLSADAAKEVLSLFGYSENDLDPALPPALIHGGANHIFLSLKSRDLLSAMNYDLEAGRKFMEKHDIITVMLSYAETRHLFHSRNAFASGGVYEDPATGASSAAFAGYLRDIKWPLEKSIELIQGEDMGMTSRIHAEIPPEAGSSIRISGAVRVID